ncbi:MAG: hypothetical protein NTY01_09070 [Verrucomicrobia bacterium]|nr:hypothetical protein [Verrucomicrobiota bacterium]
MNGTARLQRRDWGVAALIFMASAALRVPFRSELAYHWDCVEFTLGISDYNMSLNQPHPPGYFLFVMLGRLVNTWLGDPHASLVWVSLVAGAFVAGGGYVLGTRLFGRACGAAAAVILATGPTCWFHGDVAMATMLDSALTLTTVLACLLAIHRGGSWWQVALMSLSLALVASNRGHVATTLLPLWLYAFYRLQPPRWLKLLVAVPLTAVFCLMWLAPLAHLCGGFDVYMDCSARMWRRLAEFTCWGGGPSQLVVSVVQMAASCWTGLLLAGAIAIIELVRWALFQSRKNKARFFAQHREPLLLLACWLAPQMVCGLFVFYTTSPGHVLSYFPALTVLAGLALCRFAKGLGGERAGGGPKWAVLAAVLGAVTLVNATVFIFQPRGSFSLPLTAAQRWQDEQQLKHYFKTIRSGYPPETTWTCHHREFLFCGFQHFAYYMPEYHHVLLMRDPALPKEFAEKFWVSHQRRLTFIERLEFPPGVTRLLLVTPPPWSLDALFGPYLDVSKARAVPATGGMLYEVPADSVRR